MQFKSVLQAAITKLAEASTVQQGQDEIEDLVVMSVQLSEPAGTRHALSSGGRAGVSLFAAHSR
jgi:hypothetical protein